MWERTSFMASNISKFDLQGQSFKRNPHPTFAAMRAVGPVVPSKIMLLGKISFVTTHEATTAMLKDPEHFVVDARGAGHERQVGLKWWMPKSLHLLTQNMLGKDGDDHRRLRRLVDKAFHRKTVDSYVLSIRRVTDVLLDDLAASDDGDLVAHVARPLPLAVICDVLGLPQEDRPKFTRWMEGMSSVSNLMGFFRLFPALKHLSGYLREQFEARRRDPGDDLISALVQAEEEGDQLSEDELLAMCFLLFVAGHETTTHLISGGVLALLQNRQQLERLIGDWSLSLSATDELLRFVSPVQMTKPRFPIEDMDFFGVPLERGTALSGLLASANSDPDAFALPEQLDIGREKNRHLAFGGGPHLCLGLQLARTEMQILLEQLFQRYPDLGLGIADADLRWTGRIGIRALTKLPLAK